MRLNTCMHKNIHSHFLLLHMGNNLFNCAWGDFLINTCSHEVLDLDFNDSLAPLLISLHNRMNYAYWNSELKKSRKRKPTKHRKDKVLIPILVYMNLKIHEVLYIPCIQSSEYLCLLCF